MAIAEADRIRISDTAKKELMDWHLKYWCKGKEPSELGWRVADLLSDWVGGLHHVPANGERMDWSNPFVIEMNVRGCGMSTFDGDQLTRLVFLSLDRLVRVEIQPSSIGMIRFLFHGRQVRTGRLFDRMPTIEEMLSKWREHHQPTQVP